MKIVQKIHIEVEKKNIHVYIKFQQKYITVLSSVAKLQIEILTGVSGCNIMSYYIETNNFSASGLRGGGHMSSVCLFTNINLASKFCSDKIQCPYLVCIGLSTSR